LDLGQFEVFVVQGGGHCHKSQWFENRVPDFEYCSYVFLWNDETALVLFSVFKQIVWI